MRRPACRRDCETPQGQARGDEESGEDGQEEDGHPHLPTPGRLPAGPSRGCRPQQDPNSVEGADTVQLPHGPQKLDTFDLRCHAGPCTRMCHDHQGGKESSVGAFRGVSHVCISM